MAFYEIEFNRQREKTFSQRMKESDRLLVIERERAKARQGTRTDIKETLPESDKAQSRDIVADKIGMSGRTFDKARTIWDKAKDGDACQMATISFILRQISSNPVKFRLLFISQHRCDLCLTLPDIMKLLLNVE